MRVPGRSLAGQLAAVLAVALLIAQAINFVLLSQSRDRLRDAKFDVAIERFVGLLEREEVIRRLQQGGERRNPRWMRAVTFTAEPVAATFDVRPRPTERLRARLRERDRLADNALVATQRLGTASDGTSGRRHAVVLSIPLEDGKWLNATQPLPPEAPLRAAPLIFQTVVIYGILMAAVFLLTRRLSQPLSRLTAATRTMMTDTPSAPLVAEGPEDIRALTVAFEEMRGRIQKLFSEKDVMLGAIGHDLRTPLTSLRIRAEGVEDDKRRVAMIATIDEMSLMLEDILALARRGQAAGDREEVDLAHEAAMVIEGFEPQQERLTLVARTPVPAHAYPVLWRRALRNLIENGLRYGEAVSITVCSVPGEARVIVDDDGPGVPEADLPKLREAFVRGEGSRNRATGGAGLGLALTDSVAAAHGGRLQLENRAEGGFRAVLTIPA